MRIRSKIKIVIAILILLMFGAISTIVVLYFQARNETYNDKGLSSVEQELLVVTESYPTNFIVYGDKIDFDKSVKVSYINQINEQTLEIRNDCTYAMIIVNDLNNNVDLSDDEWNIIKQCIYGNNKYNFMYLGEAEIKQIQKLEMLDDISAFAEGDLSVGLSHEGNELVSVYGTYIKNAGYSLPEALISEQVWALKQSNQ